MARKRKDEFDSNSPFDVFFSEQVTKQLVEGNPEFNLQESTVAAVRDIGIRLPHLCQRVFFQRDAYPLERSAIIFGPPKSNKSALLYWFYNLFGTIGGRYMHLEVEDKDTPVMRLSLTGYKKDAGWVRTCKSMDDFMQAVKFFVNWYKAECAKNGVGKRVPLIMGVDSLVAKLTEEASGKMDTNDGVPGRRFADEARALNDWFKYIPTHLQGWPLSLMSINHDKPKPGMHPGMVEHSAPGGSAPNFYATYVILAEKRKHIIQKASGWEGNRIKLTMERSALGPDKQNFEVEIVWKTITTPSVSGNSVVSAQKTLWLWDKATIEMLYALSGGQEGASKVKGARGNAVRDVIGLSKSSGGRYAAKGMGVSHDEALPPDKLGALLETREDLLKQLEPALGIQSSYIYKKGIDYGVQLDEAKAQVDDFLPAIPDAGWDSIDPADPSDSDD